MRFAVKDKLSYIVSPRTLSHQHAALSEVCKVKRESYQDQLSADAAASSPYLSSIGGR